jgi:hypothetical protein
MFLRSSALRHGVTVVVHPFSTTFHSRAKIPLVWARAELIRALRLTACRRRAHAACRQIPHLRILYGIWVPLGQTPRATNFASATPDCFILPDSLREAKKILLAPTSLRRTRQPNYLSPSPSSLSIPLLSRYLCSSLLFSPRSTPPPLSASLPTAPLSFRCRARIPSH